MTDPSCTARRRFVAGLASLCSGAALGEAEPFPMHPVTLWVPWPAGGATDITMRLLAEIAGRHLGQRVLIENRVGGVIRVIEPPAQLLFNRPGDDIGQVLQPATRVLSVADAAPALPARSVAASALNELKLKLYGARVTGNAGEIVRSSATR